MTSSDVREATFCFVDLAGFTALTETHGDRAAADLIDRFLDLVEASLDDVTRVVDTIGDAVLTISPRPENALEFLAALFPKAAAEPDFPILRAGLHHGEVVERTGRFFGTTLNLAARVAGQARGGQVLATATVVAAARDAGVEITALGAQMLRNLRDPVELFSLQLFGADPSSVLDPVCRMSIDKERAAGQLRFAGNDFWFCSLHCAGLFAATPDQYVSSFQSQR
jgi:class 3 adenylate cyclase/YHS domain-containing protein